MPFEFEKLPIGVILIKPKVFGDERGFFIETYKKEDFEKAGIKGEFVQDNHSKSVKGVIRGMHFQRGKFAQAKLVRCIKGEMLDVVVDIRKDSPTFGQHVAVTLSEKNKFMLYIPRGFAHGFAALSDEMEMEYKNDNAYSVENEGGILWNDPALKIKWPFSNPIVSDKDKKLPALKDVKL